MINLKGWRKETPTMKATIVEDRKIENLFSKNKFTQTSNSYGLVDLRPFCSLVENQRELGSCTANAAVGGLEFLEIVNGMQYVDLSRLFVYYNSRLLLNDTNNDLGCYNSVVMETLKKTGVCAENTFAYDTSKVFLRPTWEAYREAYAHTIVESYNIPEDASLHENIKIALNGKHPVIFGTPIWKEFEYTGKEGQIYIPNKSYKTIGSHAMLIVGYDLNKGKYIVRNSWGPYWGEQGYCYMPFEYLDVAGASDFWVPTLYE